MTIHLFAFYYPFCRDVEYYTNVNVYLNHGQRGL